MLPSANVLAAAARVDFTPPVTSKATLDALREQRRVQRLMRDITAGKWRDLLLKISQHQFTLVENQAGRLSELLVKLNFVGPSNEMHSEVLAGEPSNVSAPEGYDGQQRAINDIKDRSLWDPQLIAAAELVCTEGLAHLRFGYDKTSGGFGTVVCVEDNEVCFPTGRLGPDQQPTAYEKRWLLELPDPADPKKKIKVLRVESHWLPLGSAVAAIAQRAYIVESSDPLGTCVTEKGVKPFDLAMVPGDPLEPLTLLPTAGLDIVQFVIGRRAVGGSSGSMPKTRLSPEDLDLLDAMTASLSRLVRSMELHADPRMRVPETALDPKTGALPKRKRVFVDPEKELEYVKLDAKFGEMIDVVEKLADHVMVGLRISRVLLGMPSKEGGSPATLGELRMNAQPTLSAARTAATWMTPALQRLWTGATVMESRLPGGGFDCGPVSVRLNTGLFTTFDDRVESQGNALERGLTSRREALMVVHQDARKAERILAEIEAEEKAKADLAAKSLMLDMATPALGGSGGASGGGGQDEKTGEGLDPSKSTAAEGGTP